MKLLRQMLNHVAEKLVLLITRSITLLARIDPRLYQSAVERDRASPCAGRLASSIPPEGGNGLRISGN